MNRSSVVEKEKRQPKAAPDTGAPNQHPADDLRAEYDYMSSARETDHPLSEPSTKAKPEQRGNLAERLLDINKEVWLVLSMLLLTLGINYLVTAQHLLLGFYTLPTIFSAFFMGRRHATLTAFASALLVGTLAYMNPQLFTHSQDSVMVNDRWIDLFTWGGMLLVTAYAMGTLHERHATRVSELQQTYQGLLMILRQFISSDKYTENHSYRVSIYAVAVAGHMGFSPERTEIVRAAALLHDIGKLDISRHLLYKANQLTSGEMDGLRKHVPASSSYLDPVGGSLGRILPIILAHHDKYDGSGYSDNSGNDIPLEARVIAVADVYDALTSDRPYRKAMSPFAAREIIENGRGSEFDPKVVSAFQTAFGKGQLEVPEIFL